MVIVAERALSNVSISNEKGMSIYWKWMWVSNPSGCLTCVHKTHNGIDMPIF